MTRLPAREQDLAAPAALLRLPGRKSSLRLGGTRIIRAFIERERPRRGEGNSKQQPAPFGVAPTGPIVGRSLFSVAVAGPSRVVDRHFATG